METQTKNQTAKQQETIASKKVSGAEALIMALIEEGIDTVFGYVGGAIMPVYDVLYDYRDKIGRAHV